MANFLEKVAFEIGLTGDYMEDKAEEVIRIAEEKELNIQKPILVGYDMNGPLTATFDASLQPLITVQKGILALHGNEVYKVIMSGWDIITLRNFRDERIGISEMGLIGELGAVYEHQGQIFKMFSVGKEKHYRMKLRVYQEAAKEGLKIAIQGNISDRVACIYFEADSEKRGNVRHHFLVRDTDIKTQDIYEALRRKEEFGFDGKKIKFKPTVQTIEEMDFVLSQVYPLNSVRLASEGEEIALWRDNTDREDFTFENMLDFAEKVIPKEWKIDPNNGWCIDIIYRGDETKLNKEYTANKFGERVFGTDDFIITNIGDKKSDLLLGGNTLFFPQYGTEAQRYCEQNDILHIPVLHAGDYSLIIAEARSKTKR